MASEDNKTKRGPGRPPGSKNKPKTQNKTQSGKTGSGKKSAANVTPEQIRQERIARMQEEYDRDRRNVDVIWSITLFAFGLFLLFTVVRDSTGSFGMHVHDICLGLFGMMAYVLPFMVILFGILLLAGKMQHIGGRTIIFSILIFINMCILNSYRYIDPASLKYGFSDIAQYYVNGVSKDDGGVFGMELGTLLVKFFGKPGLLIIASAILVISVFLVANSPISRFFDNLGKKAERRKILREMEEAEVAKVQAAVARTATPGADPKTGIVSKADVNYPDDYLDEFELEDDEPAPSVFRSIWRSIVNGISRDMAKDEEPETVPSQKEQAEAARKAGGKNGKIERTVIVDESPAEVRRVPQTSTQDRSAQNSGNQDSDSQQKVSSVTGIDNATLPEQKDNSVMTAVEKDTFFGRIAKKLSGSQQQQQPERMTYDDDDDTDYGYPGRRPVRQSAETENKEPKTASSGLVPEGQPETQTQKRKPLAGKSYGLDDPDEIVHSGLYGLTGTRRGGQATGLEGGMGASSGNAAGTGTAAVRTDRRKQQAGTQEAAATARTPVKDAGKPAKATAAAVQNQDRDKDDDALAESFNAQNDDAAYEFPPAALLNKASCSKQLMSDYQLEQRADLLEKTLNDFGVDAKVLTVTQGASVTRYEVQPATGVKVSSITRLSNDIALNMRAKSIRIEAPIPGKAAVGIEVENDKPSPVLVRELIESEEFRSAKSTISFIVGKDISGNNIIADLKSMPHLLIAGATGSGKSVCINTIIASFLYKAKPSELKLIMIDPKVVELAGYNGIPHLLTPVVTDARKASRALAIAVEEMDKRYELFAKEGVKDLESYNARMRADHEYSRCKPQIVIIIDELADLMMASPAEVENSICRLAQKARAAGMHLIVATQRPSVDVVTGLIKANIPSRIAFSVASQIDSRTILDMAGAEKLLGKGDMLFSPVGATTPIRVQGPFISDSETEKVIKFVKKEGGAPAYDEELQNAIDNPDKKGSSEPQDELTEDAIAFILKSRQASVSMLQRRFRIGYNRAARIIDEIEEKGIIGPSDGSRPRQVLVTEDEYYNGGANAAQAAEQYEVDPQLMAEIEEKVVGKPHSKLLSRNDNEPAAQPVGVPEQISEENPVSQDDDPVESHTVGSYTEDSYAEEPPAETTGNAAIDYFNSLPESIRKQILDANHDYND